MPNPYFNHVNNRVEQGSRALDSQINNIADEVALGFDRLPTEAELKENTTGFGVSTGTGDALVVSLPYTPTGLDGFNFFVRFNATNTGSATINVSATGVKSIVNSDGSSLTPAAMIVGTIGQFAYDLTLDRYILISNNSAWGNPTITTSQSPSEYCPGYTYVFVSATVWRIASLDVTNLFSVGRRCRFVDGASEYFGTVTASVYGTNTDITMSMEGGDVLTNTITAVCLTTGTAGWSQISSDPFAGDSINDMVMGDIGATTYAFAVGDAGKCGFSSDGGLTWVMVSTGTSEDLNACTYDSVNEQFWGGGDAGVLIDSTNATSVTLDATSIPALAGTTTDDIIGFTYNSGEDQLAILFHFNANPQYDTASSADQGAAWGVRTALGVSLVGVPNLKSVGGPANESASGLAIHSILASNTGTRVGDTGATDVSFTTGASIVPSACSCMGPFTDTGSQVLFLGGFDGACEAAGTWAARDDVTFSNRIRGFAYSPTHQRVVCVGDNQQIGYLDRADRLTDDSWVQISNGFNPLADITAVVWDDTHGNFIAVADSGQICRSTNGTN